MDSLTLVLATTAIAGLYMAWSIGANDVANAMGTSVGSKALTLRQAIVVAAIFELGGALLAGGRVSETMAEGIVDFGALDIPPVMLAGGMAASLIGAAVWVQVASSFGLPVSTTHSIVGAALGFALAVGGLEHIDGGLLGAVGVSWLISPVLGGVCAYFLFRFLQRAVFDHDHPERIASRVAPFFTFLIVAISTLLLLGEARPPLSLAMALPEALPWAALAGTVGGLIVYLRARSLLKANKPGLTERLFAIVQVASACFVAFAHGSNDVANAVAPVAVAFGALEGSPAAVIPMNVLLIGAFGIVLGLSTYGFRVIATIGREITHLTPSKGFAAEFSAALTILLASRLALPISTTNVLVGAVVGVGLNRSFGALNKSVLKGIAAGWVLTLPASALTAAILTWVLRLLL